MSVVVSPLHVIDPETASRQLDSHPNPDNLSANDTTPIYLRIWPLRSETLKEATESMIKTTYFLLFLLFLYTRRNCDEADIPRNQMTAKHKILLCYWLEISHLFWLVIAECRPLFIEGLAFCASDGGILSNMMSALFFLVQKAAQTIIVASFLSVLCDSEIIFDTNRSIADIVRHNVFLALFPIIAWHYIRIYLFRKELYPDTKTLMPHMTISETCFFIVFVLFPCLSLIVVIFITALL